MCKDDLCASFTYFLVIFNYGGCRNSAVSQALILLQYRHFCEEYTVLCKCCAANADLNPCHLRLTVNHS